MSKFKKGVVQNPGGRPKGVRTRAKEAMVKYGIHPFEFLAKLVSDNKASNRDRIAASKELLDRAYGKAQQYIDLETNQVDITIKGPEDK